MSSEKVKAPKKISRKKQVQLEITETLRIALAGLKDVIGEKKFESRIAKAAKLLSIGIKAKKTEKPA